MRVNMSFEASTQDFHIFLIEASDFRMEFEAFAEKEIPEYEGAYIVIPKVTAQFLATEDKRCTDDIQILKIPYSEVANTQSGYTAIIGGETDGD